MQSDEQLWERLKQSDREAFEMLFQRFYKDLYRYAIKFCGNRHMVEDQIQNLFLKIWTRKEHLGDVKAIKTYLWTALRRDLVTSLQDNTKRQNRVYCEDADMFTLSAEEIIIKKSRKSYKKQSCS